MADINARLTAAANAAKEAAKSVVHYGANVAREGHDVITAMATTQVGARHAKDEMQANRYLQAAHQDADKQMKEFMSAITKGKSGTRSTVHTTDVRNY